MPAIVHFIDAASMPRQASRGTVVLPNGDWFRQMADRTESCLRRQLSSSDDRVPAKLLNAMQYACLGGGKRIRPALVFATAQVVTRETSLPDREHVARLAAAVEMIHVHSLVLDDLPSMDDDDLRRGKPTVHVAFDEATAILCGDALLIRAYQIIGDLACDPIVTVKLMREISELIGWRGLIAGQLHDLSANGNPNGQRQSGAQALQQVQKIYELKTAALLRLACRAGAVVAGGDAKCVERFGQFGRNLGLAFQAVDDLLDEVADASKLGKRVRKDRKQGKATLPALVGLQQAEQLAEDYAQAALDHIADCGREADPLRSIVGMVVSQLEAYRQT